VGRLYPDAAGPFVFEAMSRIGPGEEDITRKSTLWEHAPEAHAAIVSEHRRLMEKDITPGIT
jgi:hypothetical protein